MDPDSAYENFDIKPPKRGFDPMMISFIVALVILLASAGYMAFANTKAKRESAKLRNQVASLTQDLEAKQQDMQSMISDHSAELDRLKKEWDQRVVSLTEEHDASMQRSYEMITKIVNESGQTMGQLQTLEDKIKSGKQLVKEEIDQLRAFGQGLAYLHKQYEKPLYEFAELEAFLTKEMQVQVSRPAEKTKLFKQMFSKNYRESNKSQWEAYYRDRGRVAAVSTARNRVSAAYTRAQGQMASIQVDAQTYLAGLDAIIEGKQENVALLESFFEVSNEILRVHQAVMGVEVENPDRTGTTVKP
ncbi:MAG: hypothetical protein ACI8UO_002415 [Verrucomicrobiales bacterium]|jgi:hypothetical protein